MNCREVHQSYGFYLQGKLPAPLTEFIDQHVKDCPDCFLFCREYRESFLENMTGPDDHPNSTD
jgi:hypothetical protein